MVGIRWLLVVRRVRPVRYGLRLTLLPVGPRPAQVHYETTGPEIWEATDGKVDILISGEQLMPYTRSPPG